VANRPTESEEWFDRYLAEHGYDPGDPEPDLGIRTNPDRLISRDGKQVVCEIKQFEKDVVTLIAGQVRAMSSSEWFNPVRMAVKNAAKQLKPLKGSNLPLVVVLANPKGMHVSLDAKDVIHALYGDPTWSVQIDPATGGAVTNPEFFAGLGGRLRNYHEYISAVVLLRHRENVQDYADAVAMEIKGGREPKTYEAAVELSKQYLEEMQRREAAGEMPAGDYFFVDVIKTISADATPIPDDFFNGERDRLWALNADAGGYVKVR
jgi:hypothetical protein